MTRFLELPDYTANALKHLRVNAAENNTEWVSPTTTPGAIEVDYLGVPVDVNTTLINFTGAGVVVTPISPGNVQVDISAASLAIGDTVSGGTDPSILFIQGGLLAQDPTNFSYQPQLFFNVDITDGATYNSVLQIAPASAGLLTNDIGTGVANILSLDNARGFTLIGSLGIAASGISGSYQSTTVSSTNGTTISTGLFDPTQFIIRWSDNNLTPTFATVQGDGGSAQVSWTNQVIDSRVDASSNRARIQFDTGAGNVANSVYNATSIVTTWTDNAGTTTADTFDATQFDSRYINALSQQAFSHGDNGSYTSGFYDPSALSQSFTLNTADSATLRWRLTTPNSPNGIFTVDSTGSHSYFNFSDGTGNTSSYEATPSMFDSHWTDSSTLSSGISGGSGNLTLTNNDGVSVTTVWLWPTTDGNAGDAIITDGLGNLSFATILGSALVIGSSIGFSTPGSVLFVDSSNQLAEDNANFFWDDTQFFFGVGTATPAYSGDFQGLSSIPAFNFIGSGLNDATAGGTFTGFETIHYVIQIDSVGATDTFKVKKNNQIIASLVAIDGSAQLIGDGVTVQFAATTGHTLNDQWSTFAVPNGIVNAQTAYYMGGSTFAFQDLNQSNLAVGNNTFQFTSPTANQNTAFGLGALNFIHSGTNNTGIGLQAGAAIRDGNDNITIGINTIVTNVSDGDRNIAIGNGALQASMGDDNVAVGHFAGNTNVAGSHLTLIGSGTDTLNNTDVGGIALGAEAITTNNTLVVGSENWPIISSYWGKGISSATPSTFIMNAAGGAGTDIQGGGLAFQDGAGTGTAGGSGISFATSEGSVSSSTPNAPTNAMVIQGSDVMIAKGFSVNDQEDASDSNVTLTLQQHMVAIYDNTGPITVFLPQISTVNNGKEYIIKDGIGTANTWNIQITPFAGDTVDLDATGKVITTNWGSYTLVANRSRGNWEIIAKV